MRDDKNCKNCNNCKNCKEVYAINKPALKLMAVFLVFIMVFQIVACDKKNTYEPEYVASDALWYESTRVVLERMLFENEIEYSDSQLVGVSGDYIVSRISGSYKIPDDANFAEVDYSDFEIGMLVTHDFEGNVVGTFDYRAEISDKLSSAGYDVYFSIDDMGVFGEDEAVVGVVELQDKATYLSVGLALVRIDLETKELSLDLDFGGDFDANPNENEDYYVCPMGQHMERIGTKHSKTASGYCSENVRYRAQRCSGCPLRCLCYKSKGERRIIDIESTRQVRVLSHFQGGIKYEKEQGTIKF